MKIGRTNQVTLKAAEAQSIRIAERIRAGDIPKEVSPEEMTLADIAEDYRVNVGQHQHRWRDKNRRLKKWLLQRFGKVTFLSIKRAQVNGLLNEVAKTSRRRADQVLTDLQALEKHFLGMDCVPDDYDVRFRGNIPRRAGANPRDRVLSHKELAAVWIAAGDAGRFGVVIKLCLYSAQRLDKILSMQWNDLNRDTGEWRIPTLKGKKGVPRVLVLPPAAIALIRTQLIPETQLPLTPYVFHSTRTGLPR